MRRCVAVIAGGDANDIAAASVAGGDANDIAAASVAGGDANDIAAASVAGGDAVLKLLLLLLQVAMRCCNCWWRC
jgi:hypothetical protein